MGTRARDAEAEATAPQEDDGVRRYFTVRGKRYDWPRELTGRELRYVRTETGLRSGEMDEALEAGDSDALLALVVIAMRRAGLEDTELDDLLDLTVGHPDGVDFVEERPDDEDDDDRPTAAADGADGADAAETAPTRKGRKGGGGRSGGRSTPASTASGRGS